MDNPNRLVTEKSPYLLQHAHNPVQWYPWNEEALRKAKNDGKPIFLSIGYSTCHWCHVMERESYESNEIAAILNRNFVPIKVDREERPDIDEVYMKAVQAMTGQGGWPLNVFLTPDLRPFYGGTYFPPEPRYGLPSFKQLLEFVAKLWREKKGEVLASAEEVTSALRKSYKHEGKEGPSVSLLDACYMSLVASFDSDYGGFGGPPKFPLPTNASFLLRYYHRSKKELALKSAVRTLESMAGGGIHDHLGGGFHRYSVDRVWLVPHFEKMLYDNTLLARAYLEAFQLTGNPEFAEVAQGVFQWISREMTDSHGALYSAQDADTTEGEGTYYTWTPDEVGQILDRDEAELFNFVFGVTRNGNFERGRTIISRANSVETASSRFGVPVKEVRRRLDESKEALYDARLRRPKPSTDDKVLASWNGLGISALSYGYQVLADERYLKAAERCATFILGNMWKNGRLLRRYRDSEAAIEGNIEDYSFVVMGLLDLYESSFDPRWIESALELNSHMVKEFWDEEEGGFFFTRPSDRLLLTVKEAHDGPTPSGNSVAALNLLRIAELTGDQKAKDRAENIFKVFHDSLEYAGSSHTFMLMAMDFLLSGPREVVVAAERYDNAAKQLVDEFRRRFIPNRVLMLSTSKTASRLAKISEVVRGKTPLRGEPAVYICENFSCKNPITDLVALKEALE